jgi:RNA 2',3'-cyclic 3'-phosphodiesterase
MRLFIAFPLEASISDQLGRIITSLRQMGGDVKWVDSKNIHLTACFLGETDQTKVPAVNKVIDEIASQHKKVSTSIAQIGAFPSMARPRVIWVGMNESADELASTADSLVGKIRRLGFALDDKPFKPHLTLGRVREGGRMGELAEYMTTFAFAPIPVHFDKLTLYKSTLTPQGPIYEGLHSAGLK